MIPTTAICSLEDIYDSDILFANLKSITPVGINLNHDIALFLMIFLINAGVWKKDKSLSINYPVYIKGTDL